MDILIEQLVYGSFPFWDRGYDILARSSGCRAEWVAEVLAACRRFGEAPSGVTPASALFSVPLPSGPRVIVGVEPQGLDDWGRPGALAFHALLVDPGDYRKSGANPFVFAGAIGRHWSPDTTLTVLRWTVEPVAALPAWTDPRACRMIAAISKGRRVAIDSPEPLDALAREVWPALPDSIRRKASVATWAFGNANRFDLVGLPRMAGVELDSSYLDPAAIDVGPDSLPPARPGRSLPYRSVGVPILVILAGVLAAGLAWRGLRPSPEINSIPQKTNPTLAIRPAERSRILDRLEALADRLEVGGSNAPGDLLATISTRFHYQGPFLSREELTRLAAETDPDRDRALEWHDRITRTFAGDRPLSENFATLSLTGQMAQVAWSFHLAPASDPEVILADLFEALSRPGPIRPTPLAARYPALSDYARFLAKLPRRK